MNVLTRLILSFFLYAICLFKVFQTNDADMPMISNFAMSIAMSFSGLAFYCAGKLTFYLSVNEKRKLTFFEIFIMPFFIIFLIGLPFSGFYFVDSTTVISCIILVFLLYDKNLSISRFLWDRRVKDFVKYPDSGIVDARTVEKKRIEFFCFCLLLPLGIFLLSKAHGH